MGIGRVPCNIEREGKRCPLLEGSILTAGLLNGFVPEGVTTDPLVTAPEAFKVAANWTAMPLLLLFEVPVNV